MTTKPLYHIHPVYAAFFCGHLGRTDSMTNDLSAVTCPHCLENIKTALSGTPKINSSAPDALPEGQTKHDAGVTMGLPAATSERGGNCVEGQSHTVRIFDTGATRSPQAEKLCYDRFLSPLVLKRFAEYMHGHRKQADGTLRDPDNWQKGIPQESYMDSMARHEMDVWLHQSGFPDEATEDIETALCGLMFNAMGMLFEVLRERRQCE